MKVLIDDRESKSRIKSAQKFFNTRGYSTEVEHLAVGDYIFHDRICFEYKTASDMIGSIKDGRVFRQARNMNQYEYSFIVVEGSVAQQIHKNNEKAYWNSGKFHKSKGFTVDAWIGAYARLETYSNVLVVDNRQQSWKLMDSLVSKIFKDNLDVKMVDRPQSGLYNPIASYLSCIYVNDTQRLPVATALKIIDELGLEKHKDLDTVEYDDLIQIDGIGKKTADAVIKAIR